MSTADSYALVAVSGPMRKSFVYRLPSSLKLEPGQRVLVPFGSTKKVGFYLKPTEPQPDIEIKEIIKPLDEHSLFPDELFRLCTWMAEYYFANPADCLSAALPPQLKTAHQAIYVWGKNVHEKTLPDWLAPQVKPHRKISRPLLQKIKVQPRLFARLKQERTIVEVWRETDRSARRILLGYSAATSPEKWEAFFAKKKFQPELYEGVKKRAELMSEYGWTEHYLRQALKENILTPVYEEGLPEILDFIQPRQEVSTLRLTEEQQTVVKELTGLLDTGFSSSLLHGVTGSGKTIVYCHLAEEVLRRGKTVLVLTPEIALAGSTLAYFRGFFGERVTIIHSAMTDYERLESWDGIRQGKYKIVIGPRSAVFAPLPSLGLIIVDEEHDGSYKQDDPAPRFHGRDVAIMRAKINALPIVLGSASPSVESYHHTATGRYRLFRLCRRPGEATLPTVRVIDMRRERIHGDLPFFSYPLKKEVEKRLAADEQVILYLNRRGYSPMLKCLACGYIAQCPHCQVNLTFHKSGNKLSCHYCGYVTTSYHQCTRCGGTEFLFPGAGTQKVEESIPRLFENARVVRFDSDTVTGRAKAYRVLSAFAKHEYNILLGTQMVTKGLDLSGVTLVGVLSADLSLDLPDFRAAERTFAQLLQVAGRSGRAERAGEVIIQTYYPDSPVIHDAAAQNYEAFYEREIHSRRQLSYPPFTRLVNIIFSSPHEKKLETLALQFREHLSEKAKEAGVSLSFLGPAPCPLYYLRKRYRRHLIIKTTQMVKLVRLLHQWEEYQPRFQLPSTVKIVIDVDPDDMM